jgi:hypothetical protein
MEIESGSCKDKYIPLVSGRDLYIRSAYVINNELSSWEKENAVLRELKPVAAVQKLIDSVAASGRVGLHVRMEGSAGTDHNSYDHEDNWLPESHKELNLWRGRSHYDSFIARIEKMISEDGSRRFFLAADTPEGYHALAERYQIAWYILGGRSLTDQLTNCVMRWRMLSCLAGASTCWEVHGVRSASWLSGFRQLLFGWK